MPANSDAQNLENARRKDKLLKEAGDSRAEPRSWMGKACFDIHVMAHYGSFRKLGGTLFWGPFFIGILLFRVLY